MNCTTVDPMAHWLTLQIPEPFRAAVMIEVGRLARRAQLESSDTTAKRTANGPKPIGSRQSTLSPGRKFQSTILRTERLYLYTFFRILKDRLGGSAGALTPTRNKNLFLGRSETSSVDHSSDNSGVNISYIYHYDLEKALFLWFACRSTSNPGSPRAPGVRTGL